MTAEFAVTIFVMCGAALFFLLPRIYGQFLNHEIVNLLITRCCYVIGFYFMVLNSSIIAEIATTAGYTAGAVWRYMWVFGKLGYLLLFFITIKTVFDAIELSKKAISSKRGLE